MCSVCVICFIHWLTSTAVITAVLINKSVTQGLAVFNSVILDVTFPIVLYK